MDMPHQLSTHMIVQSLDPQKDMFCPKEPNEEILGSKVPYLNEIRALIYLASNAGD